MATQTYELTYIINAVINDDQIRGLVNRVHKFIDENGGDILEVDEWGSRRLSFPINKKRNGHYVNLYFEAEGDLIVRLERALTLEDDILRYLTLKLDAKMLRAWEESKKEGKRRLEAERLEEERLEGERLRRARKAEEEEDDEDEDDDEELEE
jgi:small subunit ribosomal protein S6